jgi:hypothetical protein
MSDRDAPITVGELIEMLSTHPKDAVVRITVVDDDEDPMPGENLHDDQWADTVLRRRTIDMGMKYRRQVDGEDRDVLRLVIKHADY